MAPDRFKIDFQKDRILSDGELHDPPFFSIHLDETNISPQLTKLKNTGYSFKFI